MPSRRPGSFFARRGGIRGIGGAGVPPPPEGLWSEYGAALFIDAAADELYGETRPTIRATSTREVMSHVAGTLAGFRATSTNLGGKGFIADGARIFQAATQNPGDLLSTLDGSTDWTVVLWADGSTGSTDVLANCATGISYGTRIRVTGSPSPNCLLRDAEGDSLSASFGTWNANTARCYRFEYDAAAKSVRIYVNGASASLTTNAALGSLVDPAPAANALMTLFAAPSLGAIWNGDVGHISVWPRKLLGTDTHTALAAYLATNWTNFTTL